MKLFEDFLVSFSISRDPSTGIKYQVVGWSGQSFLENEEEHRGKMNLKLEVEGEITISGCKHLFHIFKTVQTHSNPTLQ